MKQSNHYKQTSKLTQYSSGEDDSGTEDIFTQKDFVFSGYLHRPIDLKQKKTLSPTSNLRQNRLRRTVMIDTPVLSVTPTRVETNTIRKTSTRLVTSTLLPNPPNSSRLKHSASKNAAVRHRSPVVRARLWTERNSASDLLDDCGTGPDSEMAQGMRVLCEPSEQVPSNSGNTNDNMHIFPRQGPRKNSENCRKVLSDITKETVTDFRFQFPSYYSRDVLPLDAEVDSKPDDLLSTKDNKNENSFVKKDTCSYEEPTANGIPTITRSTFSNSLDMSKEFKTTEEKGWFSLHYQKVSMILVIIVLLFFFGVGVIYLNVRFKDAQSKLSHEYESKDPVCSNINNHVSCIKEDQLNAVKSLFKLLTPYLMARARDSLCNSSGNNMSMSHTDVVTYIQNINSVSREDAEKLLHGIKLLVLSNPHWDITVVQDSPVDVIGSEGHRNGVFNDSLLQHGQLVFRNPLVPLNCQLKLWVKAFFIWVSSSTAVCIVVTGMLIGLWDYKRRCEQHRQEVYTLVNKIINAVRNHQRRVPTPGIDGTPFIPIEICQNEIISAPHSRYLSSAWEEAVRFIEIHESRILTEVHILQGKPTKVWQWLCVAPQTSEMCAQSNNANLNVPPEEPENSPPPASFVTPAHSSSSWTTKCRRNKVWQGQAFETIAGSPNSLPCSPTPCLKIRHMFDPDLEHGDDWPILIQDSILEKCEDVLILHLFVDCSSQEGCVFMKCSSSEEAGKAYRALHGWWFDTKLVTVKYLRTERYHERFPEAVSASSPLRPSNNQRLSLQELWHFPREST